MRLTGKVCLVAVGLFAIALSSASVRANDVLAGSFALSHATQWKSVLLPAGNYTFRMARTTTDANILMIRGESKTLDMYVSGSSACETCKSGALKVIVQGESRAVTSLELPGYHVNFKTRWSAAQKEEQAGKTSTPSEQVAVHVDSN